MKNPVLVRKTNITREESAAIGVQTNAETKDAQAETEIAKAKLTQMTPQLRSKIEEEFKNALSNEEWKDVSTIKQLLDNKELGENIFRLLHSKIDGVISDYEVKKYWDSDKNNVNKDAIIPILFGMLYNGAGRYLNNIPSSVNEGLEGSIGTVLSIDTDKSPELRDKLNQAIAIIGKHTKFREAYPYTGVDKKDDTALSYIESINDMFDGEAIADPQVCGLVNMLQFSKPNEIKANLKKLKAAVNTDMFDEGQTVEEAIKELFPAPEKYQTGIHMDRMNKSLLYKVKKTFLNMFK